MKKALLFLLLGLMACGEDTPSPAPEGDSRAACVQAWDSAYAQRFTAGETYFLPRLKEEAACEGLTWALRAAPESNEATLRGSGAEARLTPLVPGVYTFELNDAAGGIGVEQELEVIDALERPFHNYNYWPSHRAAIWVQEQLWVAGVYSPQIARFDPATESSEAPILVGQWPVSLAYAESEGMVLVANKGSDTLGFVEVASAQQVDAIWVGDEPSNIVWDAARGRAYVSLSGAAAVAVVDVAERRLIQTVETVFDPLAMAMSPDGGTLLVASHRSGQSVMYPYLENPVEDEKDVALVDLESLAVSGHILEVAATIQAMDFVGETLWMTATTCNPEGPLNDAASLSFQHELFSLEVASGVAQRGESVDLSRQESSTGSTATIHGFARCGDSIWVAAEGADVAVELGGDLSELSRVTVAGRPRVLLCGESAVWILSSNRMEVTRVMDGESTVFPLNLTDRRDPLVSAGLEHFAGQGSEAGDNRSCNNCHADGLSDGVVWNAGPVVKRELSRPFRWLEGTAMIGWDGYVGSVKISGYVGGSTINKRGNTESSKALGAYLASLMPSPPANSLTQRDGALSAAAEAGRAVFEGKGACTGCHTGEVLTNLQIFENGVTPGRTDVPSLVDVARIGAWYKTGEMSSLHDTVADTSVKFGSNLNDEEVSSVTRYLEELTGRDFFVLHADFGPAQQAVAVDAAPMLTWSYPVWDAPENLARLQLLDAEGKALAVTVSVDNRHLWVRPESSLDFESAYTLVVAPDFAADDARSLGREIRYEFSTAKAPAFRTEGQYSWTVAVPMLNFLEGTFDYDNIVEQTSTVLATESENGANVQLDFGGDMVFDDVFVLDGTTLRTRHLPVAVGPSFLNGYPLEAEVQDEDGDGVWDRLTTVSRLTGPGVDLEDIEVRMEKVPEEFVCVPGTEGENAPVVTETDGAVTIDWGDSGAIALLVASPDAKLPLGPGAVEGGTTYWVVTAAAFPTPFQGPVTYGVVPEGGVDDSETSGAPLGGAPFESGQCIRFSVVVDLQYSHTIIEWP